MSFFPTHLFCIIEYRVGELNKGYFGDFADVQKTGGKAWIAPETVIRADVSSHNMTWEEI